MIKVKLFILKLLILIILVNVTGVSIISANPGGVGDGNRLPRCASCHNLDTQEESNNLKVYLNSYNFKADEEVIFDVYSINGDNSVRGAFIVLLDGKINKNNYNQQKLFGKMINPNDAGFLIYNENVLYSDNIKYNINYREQYYMYRKEPITFRLKAPSLKEKTSFTFFIFFTYGKNKNEESIYKINNAQYIVSSPVTVNVLADENYTAINEEQEDALNGSYLEKIKISFFDAQNLSFFININIIALIMLTVTIILFIMEKYYLNKINELYSPHKQKLSMEETKDKGMFLIYNIARYTALYLSIIFMGVILIKRQVWIINLDRYISVYSIPMLIGFILIGASAILNVSKPIEKDLRNLIFKTGTVLGYLLYGLGFFFVLI